MDLTRVGRNLSYGRWSIGLAVASFALVFLTGFVMSSILAGHPTVVPPQNVTGPSRLAGFRSIGLVVGGVIVLCAVGALVLGILGIRREKSASAWIGAFGGLTLVAPMVASLVGFVLARSGVGRGPIFALEVAVPNLVLVLILLAVGRLVWRAVRQGPPRG